MSHLDTKNINPIRQIWKEKDEKLRKLYLLSNLYKDRKFQGFFYKKH